MHEEGEGRDILNRLQALIVLPGRIAECVILLAECAILPKYQTVIRGYREGRRPDLQMSVHATLTTVPLVVMTHGSGRDAATHTDLPCNRGHFE